MPLRTDSRRAAQLPAPRPPDTFKLWTRKAHYYLGLYFLFFLWLFAFTGLLLNHPWKFAEFWPNRKVSKFARQVEIPAAGSDLDRARSVMKSLEIEGEIQWSGARPNSTVLQFQVSRPGRVFNVTANPAQHNAAVEQIEFNAWGVMRTLHTFMGVRAGDARNDRDWFLTTLWAISMDAVSIGLIVLVLSGAYMWYILPAKRRLGAAALILGTAACMAFVFGLRWI